MMMMMIIIITTIIILILINNNIIIIYFPNFHAVSSSFSDPPSFNCMPIRANGVLVLPQITNNKLQITNKYLS
jgi:hypothetical protein